MEYRYLGSSGLKLSALSLGSWVTFGNQIDDQVSYECAKVAYEAGVNFFDTAEQYADGKAELVLGGIVKRAGWKRSDLVISTKIFWGGPGPNDVGLSRKHIIEGLNASLERLQMDYVDLLFCHRPDKETPIEETVRAMNYVIDQGMAFYWGTSEWSAQEIMQAYATARNEHLIPPLMEQPEYNMFNRRRVESEYAPLYTEIGLGTTIYSPLASGLLTGKYSDGIPEGTRVTLPGFEWLRKHMESDETKDNAGKVKQITYIANELGCSMAQLALAWCLKNPQVTTVITGASRPQHVKENMKAHNFVDKWTDDVLQRLEGILSNKPHPEPDFRSQ
jgi:voltage-dependent potassium channel beta subunit